MQVPEIVEHLVGMQAQMPRDPYISLWSHLRDFEPATLERLLLDRQAVRMTLMRTTLHLVTARDAPVLRTVMQGVCERGYASSPYRRQNEGIDLAAVVAAGATIVEDGPCTMTELGRKLHQRWPTYDATAMAYAVRYIVPLVQVTPRGLLRRSAAPRVTTLSAWLDLAPADDHGTSTDRLCPRLRSYRDEARRELLDVEDGVFATSDEPAPVRFTGEFDNVFLAHADRSRIRGDLSWGETYLRTGAFFVDGFLAGAWRLRDDGARASLVVQPRRPLTPTEQADATAKPRPSSASSSPTRACANRSGLPSDETRSRGDHGGGASGCVVRPGVDRGRRAGSHGTASARPGSMGGYGCPVGVYSRMTIPVPNWRVSVSRRV